MAFITLPRLPLFYPGIGSQDAPPVCPPLADDVGDVCYQISSLLRVHILRLIVAVDGSLVEL